MEHVFVTLECINCKNSSKHPIAGMRDRQVADYFEYHSKCQSANLEQQVRMLLANHDRRVDAGEQIENSTQALVNALRMLV